MNETIQIYLRHQNFILFCDPSLTLYMKMLESCNSAIPEIEDLFLFFTFETYFIQDEAIENIIIRWMRIIITGPHFRYLKFTFSFAQHR